MQITLENPSWGGCRACLTFPCRWRSCVDRRLIDARKQEVRRCFEKIIRGKRAGRVIRWIGLRQSSGEPGFSRRYRVCTTLRVYKVRGTLVGLVGARTTLKPLARALVYQATFAVLAAVTNAARVSQSSRRGYSPEFWILRLALYGVARVFSGASPYGHCDECSAC